MADRPLDAGAAGVATLGDRQVARLGYGAMRLSGPDIMGPPRDRDEAVAVLRRAVELGVNHIDTSDYYGPYTVNEVIREALHPYPDDLVLVTKIGARRTPDGAWPEALSGPELTQAVHDNLDHLGLDVLDVVNVRLAGGDDGGPSDGASVAEPFETALGLREQGLIRHVGVSNVTATQLAEARSLGPVACVQNAYNLAHRDDDGLIDTCEEAGIAFVPFFPLGGFSPLQEGRLDAVADGLGASPLQVALAWLLHRSPSILCIPGTSSVAHLEDNVAAAGLHLEDKDLAELDALA